MIFEFFLLIRTRNTVSKKFAICPLLTDIAHLLEKSYVAAKINLTEPIIFYLTLMANPSSGKSTAMSVIK